MPYRHSFPSHYDMVPSIKITSLKNWGYLEGKRTTDFDYSWTGGWMESKTINVIIDTNCEKPCMLLQYDHEGESMQVLVYFTFVKSNLGKGLIWYFECPYTGKHCRKLYHLGKYFAHREAFNNACYMSQTLSDNKRWLSTGWVKFNRKEKALGWLHGKHFKTHYKGKPTKRYLQALKWIEEGEGISEEMLLIG